MKEFDVEVKEVLIHTEKVRANTEDEAIAIVSEMLSTSGTNFGGRDDTDDVTVEVVASHELQEKEKIRVLCIAPGMAPVTMQIEHGLKTMQKIVGGHIQAIYPYNDSVALICADSSKLYGAPLNRAIRDKQGTIYDIIAGTFLVVGLGEDDFCSLTQEQVQKYEKLFHTPEHFLPTYRGYIVVPQKTERTNG